jgi:anti-sigma factor RsiW
MASCSQVVALLVDYVEERLPEDRRAQLERHLAGCGSCAAALNTYRSTVTLLGSLTENDLPAELRLRLRSFLDRESAN